LWSSTGIADSELRGIEDRGVQREPKKKKDPVGRPEKVFVQGNNMGIKSRVGAADRLTTSQKKMKLAGLPFLNSARKSATKRNSGARGSEHSKAYGRGDPRKTGKLTE